MNKRNTSEAPRQVALNGDINVTGLIQNQKEQRLVFNPFVDISSETWGKMALGVQEALTLRTKRQVVAWRRRDPDIFDSPLEPTVLPLCAALFSSPEQAKHILTEELGSALQGDLQTLVHKTYDYTAYEQLILGANLKIAYPHLFNPGLFTNDRFIKLRDGALSGLINDAPHAMAMLALGILYPEKTAEELGFSGQPWQNFLSYQKNMLMRPEHMLLAHAAGYMLLKIFSQKEDVADAFMMQHFHDTLRKWVQVEADPYAWNTDSTNIVSAAILSSKTARITADGYLELDFGKREEGSKDLPKIVDF